MYEYSKYNLEVLQLTQAFNLFNFNISERNIVLFNPLLVSDSYIYYFTTILYAKNKSIYSL